MPFEYIYFCEKTHFFTAFLANSSRIYMEKMFFWLKIIQYYRRLTIISSLIFIWYYDKNIVADYNLYK